MYWQVLSYSRSTIIKQLKHTPIWGNIGHGSPLDNEATIHNGSSPQGSKMHLLFFVNAHNLNMKSVVTLWFTT